MTSIRQTTVPAVTALPTSTYGGAPGTLGAVERAEHRRGDRAPTRRRAPARRGSVARWRFAVEAPPRRRPRAARAAGTRASRSAARRPATRRSAAGSRGRRRRSGRSSWAVAGAERAHDQRHRRDALWALRLLARGDRAGLEHEQRRRRGRSPTRRPGGRRSAPGPLRARSTSARRRSSSRHAAPARDASTAIATGPVAVGVGNVLEPLVADRATHRLAGDLADQVLSGVTSPPTTLRPSPQLASIATTLGSPLTGLHVNSTPDTAASTISCTVTPIAASAPPSGRRAR